MVYCLESDPKFTKPIIGYLEAFKTHQPLFKLNEVDENKLLFKSNILFWLYMKLIGNSFAMFIAFDYIVTALLAYCLHGDQYNNLILLSNLGIELINLDHVKSLSLSTAFIFYVPITFFNLKLKQLANNFRMCSLWANARGLCYTMLQYDQLTRVIKDTTQPYNMLIGMVYFVGASFIALNFEVGNWVVDQNGKLRIFLIFYDS